MGFRPTTLELRAWRGEYFPVNELFLHVSFFGKLSIDCRHESYHRTLKLARTIADLAGSEEILSVHLADALQYRPKLMMG